MYPISLGNEWLQEVPTQPVVVPQPSLTVGHQTIVNNEGCSFGTVTQNNRYDTQLAVESTIIVAEQRHQMAIA